MHRHEAAIRYAISLLDSSAKFYAVPQSDITHLGSINNLPKQIDSVDPRRPYPVGHEKAARPPTSRERIATRGFVPFIAIIGTSPHSTPNFCFKEN